MSNFLRLTVLDTRNVWGDGKGDGPLDVYFNIDSIDEVWPPTGEYADRYGCQVNMRGGSQLVKEPHEWVKTQILESGRGMFIDLLDKWAGLKKDIGCPEGVGLEGFVKKLLTDINEWGENFYKMRDRLVKMTALRDEAQEGFTHMIREKEDGTHKADSPESE